MSIARYSFFPWLRTGIANQLAPATATTSRATVDVTLRVASEVEAQTLPSRRVQLVGPGDVLGINAQAVVRTEPRNWVTDFEPNYLAHVEFYDEDFPWRYSPTAPDTTNHRLVPWITLLLLKEGEFTRDTSPSRPLPSITLSGIPAASVLPPDAQLYAWAHVHLNESFGTSRTPDLNALGASLRSNPDLGYSRLLSPRKLEPNSAYYAFVIPTFEVGRKAGLGQPVAETDSGIAIAWALATEFPVYFEWFFRTGAAGDFESLVRALKPRAIDKRVGIRSLDVQQPGFLLPPIASPPDDVVGLEGAVLAPTSQPVPLDPASNFFPEIETIVNLAADAEEAGVTAGDPVVTAPLYGRWHALVKRISADPAKRDWVNELNIDPRMRAVAGFGTRVIQKRQEEYMRLAWEQIGDVLAANRRIHFVQFALQASQRVWERHVVTLDDERALAMTAPVFARVMGSPTTVRTLVDESRLPRAAVSGAFRKQLRPRGLLARRSLAQAPDRRRRGVAQAVAQLNAGAISAAPPRVAPKGPTLESVIDARTTRTPPPNEWLATITANRRVLFLAVLIAAVLAFLTHPTLLAFVVSALAIGAAYYALQRLTNGGRPPSIETALTPVALTAKAVDAVGPQPTFVLAPPGSPVPTSARPIPAPGPAPADSPDARDFRTALTDFHALLSIRADPLPTRAALPLDRVRTTVLRAIEPARAFPARIAPLLKVGARSLSSYVSTYRDDASAGGAGDVPRVVTVMAYPDIPQAMYEPLCDLSSELLVPNLRLIDPNTISLMVRNLPFIEAYMLGLNHEFARELLWREYPTDQRPSTFRQFWDVSQVANVQNIEPTAFQESLRDIVRIHEWAPGSHLGDHNNRHAAGDPPEDASTPLLKRAVILVIRGDLLKRYPNTIIYAQRARWGTRADNALRLVLWDETGEKSENDPTDPNIRYPQYKAFVRPDIHFIGFDLSIEEVRGDPTLEETAEKKATVPANKLGWFFALKEVVGEPRFGLDDGLPVAPEPIVWDNLAWQNLGDEVTVIDVAAPFAVEPGGTDRQNVAWGANSADMAFILYQKPVLVAVHAREMLKGTGI
jgi:hypothetical protein